MMYKREVLVVTSTSEFVKPLPARDEPMAGQFVFAVANPVLFVPRNV